MGCNGLVVGNAYSRGSPHFEQGDRRMRPWRVQARNSDRVRIGAQIEVIGGEIIGRAVV
jgi:hypothetical protein